MLTRIGGLLLVSGAVLTFVPWVATAVVGAPLMIAAAILLAVAIERTMEQPTVTPQLRVVHSRAVPSLHTTDVGSVDRAV